MSGFGTSSMGTSPFGVGTPVTGSEPPEAGPICSRYLNPQTRQYEVDPITGQLAQMPGVRQRLLLRLMTLRASSTVLRDMGVRLPRRITASFAQQARTAVAEALQQEVQIERVARIDDVFVERSGAGRTTITVSYTDLSSGEPGVPLEVTI